MSEKIRDLPSAKGVTETADGLDALLGFLKPFELFLPASTREAFRKSREDVKETRRAAERLFALPDRFNDYFAKRGWIAFGQLSTIVMEEAVALADAGKLDDAERILVEHWTPDLIRLKMNRLKQVEAFIPRVKMAWEAEELYDIGRFSASTMLVLAIADGLVQVTSARFLNKNRNLSADGTDLSAWDSIAGHSTGLNQLKELFFKTRGTTNEEPLTMPFRHGIMHGMDVNFNSRLVAAKTWALLFAVGEWALLAQTGKLKEPAPTPKPTTFQVIKQAVEADTEIKKMRDAAGAFKPRTDWADGNIPATGAPDAYTAGTPERTVVDFLTAWTKGNYGVMAQACSGHKGHREDPGRMRDAFRTRTATGFRILGVADETLTRSRIRVEVTGKVALGEGVGEYELLVFKKDEAGDPAILKPGTWLITDYYGLIRRPPSKR